MEYFLFTMQKKDKKSIKISFCKIKYICTKFCLEKIKKLKTLNINVLSFLSV